MDAGMRRMDSGLADVREMVRVALGARASKLEPPIEWPELPLPLPPLLFSSSPLVMQLDCSASRGGHADQTGNLGSFLMNGAHLSLCDRRLALEQGREARTTKANSPSQSKSN